MTPMTRRDLLRTAAGAGVASLTLPSFSIAAEPAKGFTLPPLPYAFDALEPHIDARTMEIHHDRHHKGYVTNLNKALMGTDWASMKIEDILANLAKAPEKIRTAVRNNGGGHYNHSAFWQMMSPKGGKASKATRAGDCQRVQGHGLHAQAVEDGGDGPLRQRLGLGDLPEGRQT